MRSRLVCIYGPLCHFGRNLLSLYGKEQHEHATKHLNLCSMEETESYRFGTTWGCINDIFVIYRIIICSSTLKQICRAGRGIIGQPGFWWMQCCCRLKPLCNSSCVLWLSFSSSVSGSEHVISVVTSESDGGSIQENVGLKTCKMCLTPKLPWNRPSCFGYTSDNAATLHLHLKL